MSENTPPEKYSLRRKIGLIAGPVLFFLILIIPTPEGMPIEAKRAAAVAVFMAVWWLSEAIHISATALLPMVLFPLLGVSGIRETTASYGDSNIYLFFGGFLIAAAMEKCNLHVRIAYAIITKIGKSPGRIILGFIIAAAFLSMWISNTATALMMLPIGLAVIKVLEEMESLDSKTASLFGTALMLGIAYGANVGGIGTLIGTPPNIIFISSASTLYPEYGEIGFLQWMLFAVPVTIFMMVIIWIMLTKFIFKFPNSSLKGAYKTLVEKREALGSMKPDEKKVLVVFLCTAAAWIFRKNIAFGDFVIPGWSELFPNPEYINDATVAITAAVILFITPVDRKFNGFLLTWKEAQNIPWGILILFGGGIALAAGFSASGLSEWIGQNLSGLKGIPTWLFIFAVSLLVTFLTEITSNTATASIFMPVMGGLAVAMGYHPYLLMLPAALSASCAFMLPVATPPNAIVFGSGKISMMQMARAGLILNIVGAVIITIVVYFIAVPVLGL
ncbi:MAG: SLC13/DASS family transporter [bacterium]|nr:SLC13/DASS family transporter [bacterium]